MRIIALLGVALLALALVSGTRAQAQTAEVVVDNVFFEADLRQALEDVAAQAGVNIIAEPSVQGIVSATLEGVPVARALELMLAGTGFRVSRQPDYFLVYAPDVGSDVFAEISETRLVALDHVTPATARTLLANPLQRFVRVDEQAGRLAVTAPEDLMARILADLALIDQPSASDTALFALQYIRADNARELLPETLQRFVRIDLARNTLAVTAPPASRNEIVEFLRRVDVPRGPLNLEVPEIHPTRIVRLDHAPAETAMALLPEAMSAFVRSDTVSNTLAVSAPAHLVGGILEDIRRIDTPRTHVMLEARVVVLERSDLLNFGTEFTWPRVQGGALFSNAPDIPWEVRLGYTPNREFTNALSLTLNLLAANNEATIVSSPQVLAQDGVEAQIRVTTEEFFQISAGDGLGVIRAQLEEIETGTILSITPRVGPNRQLTLTMDLEVSDVIGRGDNNLPVVSRRNATSTVRIEDGGTAAIAGLVDAQSELSNQGPPGLRSVPLLGRAFRTEGLNHRARQVAIFITANIVDEDSPRFQTGRAPQPAIRAVSDAQFRAELERELDLMGMR